MRRLVPGLLLVTLLLTLGVSGTSSGARSRGRLQSGCPSASVNLQSGTSLIRGDCSLGGDITLGGSATLVIEDSTFFLDGNIFLAGRSRLVVRDAVLTLANHFVLEHRIEARDQARVSIDRSVLVTNAGLAANLAAQYRGYDESALLIRDSHVSPVRSWLLADFYGHSTLRTKNSKNLPSEIYPHDSSTITIEGSRSDHRVWLEFPQGSLATVEQIPDVSRLFNFSFGRNTPGVVNISYQVEVRRGIATFGIVSQPLSDMTLKDNVGPVAIGYSFVNVDTPEQLSGIEPWVHDVTLTHQGRRLNLVNATLESFAWQIYGANPDLSAPATVRIADSTINELGASDKGRFFVENSIFQFAVIAAVGQDSSIEISQSIINSQTIFASSNAVVKIEASSIFGAFVQARDQSRILLMNDWLATNTCHQLCLPVCPASASGGCNPFNPAGSEIKFAVDGNALVMALGIDPVTVAVSIGQTYDFRGDLFVERGPGSPVSYTYNLSVRSADNSQSVAIVAAGEGPKRGQILGTLDSSGLAAGQYAVQLELLMSGVPVATVERPFTLTSACCAAQRRPSLGKRDGP